VQPAEEVRIALAALVELAAQQIDGAEVVALLDEQDALARARQLTAGLTHERWPKAARPLAALLALAAADARAETRTQGSPRRLLRMLALRLTGR
jgi:hypothetical protein